VRYLEEKLRGKDALIEKLRLKNTSLRTHVTKVDNQLKQKEELGDVLHYIDFHQLQIENKQLVKKIEEQNEELVRIKMVTGRTIQSLNSLKRTLFTQLGEQEWLENEIVVKDAMGVRLQGELDSATKEIKVERRSKKKLLLQTQDSSGLPNVEDYIMQTREIHQMEVALENWRRKVGIVQMEGKKVKKKLRFLRKQIG